MQIEPNTTDSLRRKGVSLGSIYGTESHEGLTIHSLGWTGFPYRAFFFSPFCGDLISFIFRG